ncbi:Protein PLANT CADMIUM RESISTANCE 3 [Diplonema papillatum]|nr:Protein PLANT CADMIUM RESISTANCE 3 [Diplonema papillatum]
MDTAEEQIRPAPAADAAATPSTTAYPPPPAAADAAAAAGPEPPVVGIPVYTADLLAGDTTRLLGGPPAAPRPQLPHRGAWTVGYCDFFDDVNLCCDALLCSCCLQARVFSAAAEKIPDRANCFALVGSGLACAASLTLFWPAFCVYTGVMNMWTRDVIRNEQRIAKDCWTDCVGPFACPLCAMVQHHAELSNSGIDPGYTCCKPSRQFQHVPVPPVQPGYQTC